jgi:hypothetical protein
MKANHKWLKHVTKFGMFLMMGASMSACSAMSWKEEVLLHDGSKIIVTRTVERGGRHEIGQRPPIEKQSLSFAMPGSGQKIGWEDKYSKDVGSANFNLMMLEVLNGTAYLLGSPMGCLSYNKWGRPNPPYVIFQYQGTEWKRIALQELPTEFKMPNLIISSQDDRAVKVASAGLVSAEKIRELNKDFRQPEYKTILREPLAATRINEMCEERVLYKGSWILPNDPIARKFIDQQKR